MLFVLIGKFCFSQIGYLFYLLFYLFIVLFIYCWTICQIDNLPTWLFDYFDNLFLTIWLFGYLYIWLVKFEYFTIYNLQFLQYFTIWLFGK